MYIYIYDIIWSSLAGQFNLLSFWDPLRTTFSSPFGLRKMQESCSARQKMRNSVARLSGGVWRLSSFAGNSFFPNNCFVGSQI